MNKKKSMQKFTVSMTICICEETVQEIYVQDICATQIKGEKDIFSTFFITLHAGYFSSICNAQFNVFS